MKKINLVPLIFVLLAFTLNSCDAIAGIFKAGMGFGIFIVIAVILLIVVLVKRAGKK